MKKHEIEEAFMTEGEEKYHEDLLRYLFGGSKKRSVAVGQTYCDKVTDKGALVDAFDVVLGEINKKLFNDTYYQFNAQDRKDLMYLLISTKFNQDDLKKIYSINPDVIALVVETIAECAEMYGFSEDQMFFAENKISLLLDPVTYMKNEKVLYNYNYMYDKDKKYKEPNTGVRTM